MITKTQIEFFETNEDRFVELLTPQQFRFWKQLIQEYNKQQKN